MPKTKKTKPNNQHFKTAAFFSVIVILSFLVCFSIVKAGSLNPSSGLAATMYTLQDIYTRLTTNAAAGSHNLGPSASPASTMYTLTQIYDAIPTIDATKVKSSTSYLGVAGTLVPSGGDATTSQVCSASTFFGDSQTNWTLQTGALSIDASKMLTTATYCGTTGTITAGSNVTGSNGSLSMNIPTGYYSGKTCTASDTDLVSTNIKSGATIFGVSGDANVIDTSSGTASAGDMLSGKICYVTGSQVTGNVASGSNVTGSNGSLTMTITDGLYSGSKTCTASDTNLLSNYIKDNISIFGVTGNIGLPKTGQTESYVTNDDGTYQSGAPHSPVARFTDNANGTITDNATGLMWNKCTEGLSESDCSTGSATSMVWSSGQGSPDAINTCESSTSNGYSDWRLPNIKELASIVDYGVASPAIDATYFPNTQSGLYWSSTTYAANPPRAWLVGFSAGSVSFGFKVTTSYYVRCVRQ